LIWTRQQGSRFLSHLVNFYLLGSILVLHDTCTRWVVYAPDIVDTQWIRVLCQNCQLPTPLLVFGKEIWEKKFEK
jgi:hypothetical protein